MAVNKCGYRIMFDTQTHFKLSVLALTQRMVMNDKNASISKIVDEAVNEWFDNHKDEVDNIIAEYKKNGGWLDL